MTKTVEFFYDFGSPTVYLAATQLPDIAASVGAAIDWRPMLLGGVFKSTGNQSPVVVPAKAAYMNNDLKRFAKRYGVPFRFCLLYTSPSPRDKRQSRMPSSA